MTEYILIALIAVSFIGLFIYMLIKRKPVHREDEKSGKHIFVTDGVDLNTMQYGKKKGDIFDSEELEGTVIVEGNALPICTVSLTNVMTGAEYRASFRTEVYLGRIKENEREKKIAIEGDPTISRTHCRLRYLNRQLLLDDLNAKNHTFVNGAQVSGTTLINQQDEIKIGETRLIVRYKGAGKS